MDSAHVIMVSSGECVGTDTMSDDSEGLSVERARVSGSGAGTGEGCDLRGIAQRLGLDWQRARALWTGGLLSFDPDAGSMGDAGREAEFLFLGSLATAELPLAVLAAMLRDLHRPYAYDLGRMYYDWRQQSWRLLPDEDDPEAGFFAMLARADPRRDLALLLEVRELVESALDLARGRGGLFRHVPPELPPVGQGAAR